MSRCRVSSLFLVLFSFMIAPVVGQTMIFWEDFDGLPRKDSVDELDGAGALIPDAWSEDAPAGWAIDNVGGWTSGITEVGGVRQSDGVGVTEWEGWSFADLTFWDAVAGQDRAMFTNGTGLVAVADGDEWDDIGDPAPANLMDTTLSTPAIDISGFSDVTLEFDSSWRSEEPQEGTVSYALDGGADVELLHYVGGTTPDLLNEHVSFDIATGGASNMTVKWRYFNADNDWWYAVDNVHVTGVPEPVSWPLMLLGSLLGVAGVSRRRL